MSDVVVVDFGIGNVFSVCNALKHIGANPRLSRDAKTIRDASRLILPGVGAFSRAMENLRQLGLDDEISKFATTERPLLGICIGMQVLMERSSEFGMHSGLGLIPGGVEKISQFATDGTPIRVPHIAWSQTRCLSTTTREGWQKRAFETPAHYYFVHSFVARPSDLASVLATAEYGGHEITAAISSGSITGVQFHPERSGPAGLQLLRHFVECDAG